MIWIIIFSNTFSCCVAPQNDVTSVLQVLGTCTLSSAVCIKPHQMIGLCFHLWNSEFQLYWIGLHVKASSTPRGLNCHILRLSALFTNSWCLCVCPAHCHLAVGV